jgi:hypothetical protein
MSANVLLSFAGLGNSIVAIPVTLDRRFGIVKRTIIIMCAFTHLPKVKALPSLFGDKGVSAVTVYMPLADIAGFVTGPTINLSDSHSLRIQRFVVIKNTVSQPVLPCQKACAIRTTYRAAGDGVAEIDALIRESIQVRRLNILIPHISG